MEVWDWTVYYCNENCREREREQEKEGVGVIIRWKKKKDGSLKLESYKRKARKSQNTHEMKATEIIFLLLPGKKKIE